MPGTASPGSRRWRGGRAARGGEARRRTWEGECKEWVGRRRPTRVSGAGCQMPDRVELQRRSRPRRDPSSDCRDPPFPSSGRAYESACTLSLVPAIRLDGLTKSYGKARGIVDVDLVVTPGEVFGFLGPNGAGKPTPIRPLLDLIRPTSGKAEVLGLDSTKDSLEIRRRVGYLPGDLALWEWMTTRQLLEHLGRLRGRIDTRYRDELLGRFAVEPDRKIKNLSSGNKQKVGIIQAFMQKPELIILDEPTAGLDPLMQHATYEVIEEARAEGRTVFLSSHVLPEGGRMHERGGAMPH